MLMLLPNSALSSPPSSAFTKASRAFFPQNKNRKQGFVNLFDSLKIRAGLEYQETHLSLLSD